jgi:hypothetical protein
MTPNYISMDCCEASVDNTVVCVMINRVLFEVLPHLFFPKEMNDPDRQ